MLPAARSIATRPPTCSSAGPRQADGRSAVSDEDIDWRQYLAGFHRDRAGVIEAVLSRSVGGDHTPYRWLARAVGGGAATVLDVACGSGPMSRELSREGRTVIGLDMSAAELRLAAERGPGPWIRGDG